MSNVKNTSLFIVLVDAHSSAARRSNVLRGSGRWCVRAKDEKRAEEALAKHIGKAHGSIRCYYEIEVGSAEYEKYARLSNGQCEKVC